MIIQKVQMLSAEAQRELFDRVKQFNDFTKKTPLTENMTSEVSNSKTTFIFGRLIITTSIFYITVQTRATLLLQIGF